MSLFDQKLIVVLGAGGVGKTTLSVTMALAAVKAGKRVALLSIDPAKRLADALGIELGSQLRKVDIEIRASGNGSLSAAMIDQRKVFDDIVKQAVSDPEKFKNITEHNFYLAMTQKLGGVVEYLSLAKVGALLDNERFDLIVLDTPPDNHALDFLNKPNILANFKENKVIHWLIKPLSVMDKFGGRKLFSFGEKIINNISKIVGLSALQSVAQFILLLQDVIESMFDIGDRVAETLKSTACSFVTVSTVQEAPYRAAMSMIGFLDKNKFNFNYHIFNQLLPRDVKEELEIIEPPLSPNLLLLQDRHTMEQQKITHNKYVHESNSLLICESPQSPDTVDGLRQLVEQLENELARKPH